MASAIYYVWLIGAGINTIFWTVLLSTIVPKTAGFKEAWATQGPKWAAMTLLTLIVMILGNAALWFLSTPHLLIVGILRKRRGLSFFPTVVS